MDDLTFVRALLWGTSGPREPQKVLAIWLADNGVRIHIRNTNGTSLASIKLTNDQLATLGAWLIEASREDD